VHLEPHSPWHDAEEEHRNHGDVQMGAGMRRQKVDRKLSAKVAGNEHGTQKHGTVGVGAVGAVAACLGAAVGG
jgi:hypothetical protein